MRRKAAATRLGAIAIAIAILFAVLALSSPDTPAKAASTVTFSCLSQSAALALITANPPGGIYPDTSTCPGLYDGYYTPSAATTTTNSSCAPATTATLQVQANSPAITTTSSDQIQVCLEHATPSTAYSITLKVSLATSPPLIGGGPFCSTASVNTDSNGNAQETVTFPGTFTAAACSPAGVGGPTTEIPGTYTVSVSTTGITSGSTTFTVQPSTHEIIGSGTTSSSSLITSYQLPQTLSGCATHGETTIGASSWTGVITTSSPGQYVDLNVFTSCANGSPALEPQTNAGELNLNITLPNVTVSCQPSAIASSTTTVTSTTTTIVSSTTTTVTGTGIWFTGAPYTVLCPAGGYSGTGSLTIHQDRAGYISSPDGLPSPSTPAYGGSFTVVGSGGLAGLTGNGVVLTELGGTTSYMVDLHVP